ncbi:MAG TPA: hypothetical protein VNL77_24115, partial [Roseiflexaceae bacterium]|nr:hypothetical protein [Roseiflexaceae bacterium]
ARLQDFAVTALIALPFLTPELRRTYLLRPCSPLTLQPCPPVAGMPPTTDAPWNVGRIALELAFLALLVLALLALHRSGQPLIRRAEAALGRAARPLLTLTAAATLLLGAYAYLVRPQILTGQTLTALPSCLAPAQLRQPEGPCLALQGYVGAPIAAPAYVDPLAAWLGGLPQRLRGQRPPDPAACVALRRELLPSEADGRTVPELIRDGLLDPAALDAATVERLRACDRLVLRAQFANSQANLVRVGWYTSPLGVALGLLGLALLWRRPPPGAWLFLVVALVAGVTFVRLTYGTSDQHYIYILRRYVPQVYPALAIGTAYALVALARLTNDQRPTTNDQHGSRDRSSFLVRRIRQSRERLRRVACGVLTLALTAFLVLTGLPIFRHTEYGGALGQIADAAGRFRPGDVVLLRGGAPTYAESRDLPDVIATPLTYAFGVDALTVKSREPERYAAQLARYLQEWQARGRQVYLALGASGGLAFPGLALEPAGTIALDLKEFEQLTDQKPRNVQDFQVSFTLYRVLPAAAAPPAPRALAPGDTAAQLRGLYRAETAGGAQVAWTNGDALLRLALPADASTLTVRLAGGRRPATLGPARACLSLHPNGAAGQVSAAAQPRCFTLGESLAEYTLPIEPGLAAESTLLLHIQSEPWIPARDDPQGRDPRRLGVQFGGVRLAP